MVFSKRHRNRIQGGCQQAEGPWIPQMGARVLHHPPEERARVAESPPRQGGTPGLCRRRGARALPADTLTSGPAVHAQAMVSTYTRIPSSGTKASGKAGRNTVRPGAAVGSGERALRGA